MRGRPRISWGAHAAASLVWVTRVRIRVTNVWMTWRLYAALPRWSDVGCAASAAIINCNDAPRSLRVARQRLSDHIEILRRPRQAG